MKLKAILLIVIVSVSSLSANDISLMDMKASFEESLNPNKIHFDDLLESSVSFSQDDYGVGDVIDITIHFKVNTTKNVENLKFAVLDYKYRTLYHFVMRNLKQFTQNSLDSMVEGMNRGESCVLIESDPDLILSNDYPTGSYNLKFKLLRKTVGIYVVDKQYPYINRSMTILPFYESVEYECLTDYKEVRMGTGPTMHIKINSESLLEYEPSIEPKIITKPPYTPDIDPKKGRKLKAGNGNREDLEVSILSGEVTYVGAFEDEPWEIVEADPGLGSVTLEVNYQNTGDNYIKVNAPNYTHNDYWGTVIYLDAFDEPYQVDIHILYYYNLIGTIRMHNSYSNEFIIGNGTMQKVDSEGSPYGDTSVIDENGWYTLYDFTPGDRLGYFAITERASILEYFNSNVILSNFAFNLSAQLVFAALNFDNGMIHVFFHPSFSGFNDGVWYVQDGQILADNFIFDMQKRAESFSSSDSFLDNDPRQHLLIYSDTDINHPQYLNFTSFFITAENNPYDFDLVHVYRTHLTNSSIVLHELGHAHHWHHAGYSQINPVHNHQWQISYSNELGWREGFAHFFSGLVRKNIPTSYYDYPEHYWNKYGGINIESATYNPKGNKCEGAVCCLLWDFYDNTSDNGTSTDDDLCEGDDRVSLSQIWNSVKGNSLHSIISVSDFLKYLFDNYGDYPNSAVASVMRNFEIYDIVVPDGEFMMFNSTFDFPDRVAILVEDEGELIISEDVTTIFEEDYNQIVVKGDFDTDINTSFINIGDQNVSEFVFDGSEDLNLDNVTFDNCKLELIASNLNITNSNFLESRINAVKEGSIDIDNCNFHGTSGFNPTIRIDSYDNVMIQGSHFEETNRSIMLYHVGLKGNCTIRKNTFFNTTNYSICSYNSNPTILQNEISFGEWAIYGLRISKITMSGPDTSDPIQEIHDNDRHELYFTHDSFPTGIYHNIISHDNSNSTTLIKVVGSEEAFYNVKENYWGENFDPETDFEPVGYFDYMPIWYPRGGDSSPRETVQELYNTAEEAIEEENYSYAKTILQSIIEDYPEHYLALASAKSLLHVESLSEENYLDAQVYFNTITNSNFPIDLVNCCDYLSNNCDLLMENYPEAITWFEDKIENPISFTDSIYALIDLNHTYLLLDENMRESLINTSLCFDPLTMDNFQNIMNELMDLAISGTPSNDIPTIEKVVLHKNYPNPFNPETNISFSIPEDSKVDLTIFNIKGQKVKTLIKEDFEPGKHSVIWFGKDSNKKSCSSGVYFYQLKVNGKMEAVKKCILLK